MLGYVACRAAPAAPMLIIEGARFRSVAVAGGESLRARLSARAAARTLRRAGVRLAVFPEGYPYRGIFAREGVAALTPAPLYRATAAAIARRYLEQAGIEPRAASVTLAAGSVTEELRRAAFSLAADVRYIALSVQHGGDALAEALRRELGVAARTGALHTLPRAELTLAFDGSPAGEGILRLDDTLGVVYDSIYPNALLAALWRSGALDAAMLQVRKVVLPRADSVKKADGGGPAPASGLSI